MNKTVARIVSGATLSLWAGTMLYMYFSGRADDILAPQFRPLVLIAGIALVLVALAWFAGAGADDPCDDECCAHTTTHSWFGRVLNFAVLILPLTLASWAAPETFSRTTVLNRGVITDPSALPSTARKAPAIEPKVYEPPLPTKDGAPAPEPETSDFVPKTADGNLKLEVVDLLYAAQDANLRKDIENRKVEVVGQLMPATSNNPHGDRMKIVRMFMVCCAADARPIAALVKMGGGPSDLPEMSWVRVRGTATFPLEGGRPIALIDGELVEPTSPPDESMLY